MSTLATQLDTDEDIVLKVRNASVTFDMERGQSRVLNDVSMDIYRKEILGIVGESGSGKSMFASALLDAVVPPGQLTGEVIYYTDDGQEVDLFELSTDELRRLRWEEIAMVFQGALSSFNPTMKVGEHFVETLDAHNYDRREGMEHAKELLRDLYLDPDRVLESYPHELSGGMQQRALIALSLLLEPNVLVMDEPTAALDLLMQQSILNLLVDIQEKYDLTVVFITHDLPLVAGLADRLTVMYAFEFVEIGSSDQIVSNPTHPYTQALLKSVPNLETPLDAMQPISGSSPDPVNIPVGCSYHDRCPLADERCRAEEPGFHRITDDHEAACFHWEKAAKTLSLSKDEVPVESTRDNYGDRSSDPILSLDDVSVHFDGERDGLFGLFGERSTVHAVDDVSLDMYENDVIALVGESGCGKTTLGKAAIGAVRPTDGKVTYHGQDIWEARDEKRSSDIPYSEIRSALQMIHQDPGSSLNSNRKVLPTLEVPLKRWQPDLGREDRRTRIYSMLEYVGMSPAEDYAARYPHQLSGGEKQRVALIRALLMNPDVILADEAVSALDVSLRVSMMDLMLELQDLFDTSYIFISHNLSNARYIAGKANGRIGVMYLGELVEIGPAEEVIRNPKHPYTKVLKWSTADLEMEGEQEDPPITGIDIPDAKNPPSGCRFHTRCPDAKEICKNRRPDLKSGEVDGTETACFLEYEEDHEYWSSEPLSADE